MTIIDEPPRHPGPIFRDSVLPRRGLSVAGAAEDLKIARQNLHRPLAGQATLTRDMAVRIARRSATSPDHWLAMQGQVDLWHARRDLAPLLATIAERSPSGGYIHP